MVSDVILEALDLTFDFNTSAGIGTPTWIIPVTGVALSPTVTDLALIGFLGNDLASFAFVSATEVFDDSEVPVLLGNVLAYSLTSISGTGEPLSNGGAAIPEPASLCLVGSGLLMALRRRRASKA